MYKYFIANLLYIYRVPLKMDRNHIEGGEDGSKETKNSYYFEKLAVVFELEKETSKPICG